MAYAFSAIIAILLLLLIRFAYNYSKTLAEARRIGLPLVLVPVDQIQLLWILLAPPNRERIRRILPKWLWKRVSLMIFGWEFHEKLRPFDEYVPGHGHGKGVGRTFILLGLQKGEIWTADPVAANDILTRVREYEAPHAISFALGTYGPNVLTTNGERWARHRKIITSILDERIMRAVFEESIRQTQSLLSDVFAAPEGEPQPTSAETLELFDMLKRVTIHVLLGTSMGVKVPWRKSRVAEPGYMMPHIDSLNTMVINIVGVGMLPKKLLNSWPRWLPWHDKMRTVGCAKVEVEKRSREILDQERERRARGEPAPKSTIVSKILRASEEGKDQGLALSEVEMISNLFIVTAAGFETTATTLAYAVVLLARYPEWQDWLLEEVDSLPTTATNEDGLMDYTAVFPRATRTLAFMFETLRLFPAVPHVHRETSAPQTLHTATGTIHVPADMRVYVNSLALHLLPSWRDVNRESDPPFVQTAPAGRDDAVSADEHVFRPSRWINPPGSAQAHYHPPKGTWVPWAMGPRVCPGMKMAQVEFTAAVVTLLQHHRVEVVPLRGENRAATEKRLDARLRDSRWVTVLQMNGVFEPKEGEGLPLKLSKRQAR
ncbi:cytochrome P450 monooxygenase-like protein [Parathielavia appendiculata]|uniref:Cytochrome P450 monooxygenase-like protein n=1 Tax=Parathielavia appendiculata TaxID=2587402 RepID=A0AAN6TS35_9PEZI|nr:cytochrome P450 monooxygenase-like protein [Parathielavia appendiculata]